MAELKSNFWRYILGILVGIILILGSFLLYPRVSFLISNDDVTRLDRLQNQLKVKTNKKDTADLLFTITTLRAEIGITTEKVNSLNSRFNDFYIFMGIIITLLLAVTISVYIRTENEVGKHMKANYDDYKQEIARHVQEATKLLGELQTKQAVANKIMESMQSAQNTIPQD